MNLLGIDMGGTNIRAGFVKDNQLQRIETILVKRDGKETGIIRDIISLIKRFDLSEIEGIGVGVPSVVDVEKGIVYNVNNIPCWEKVYLRNILEKEFKLSVYINNDANCFAVGEKYFGKASDYKNVIGLITGTGMGAGIILNHKLYIGNNCGAGEFGSIPFKGYDYEYYCSGKYFNNVWHTTGEELFNEAMAGNKNALSIFNEYGINLGEAIKMIMFALDPQMIVLGGSVSKSFRFYQESMWNSIKAFPYSRSAERIKVEVSETSNIAILGAAALYYDEKI